MSSQSAIEWTDSTFNPWIGCTRVGPGCDHCYAAVSTPARTMGITWGAGSPRRRTSAGNWRLPVQWNARPFYECPKCQWRGDDPTPVSTQSAGGDGYAIFCPECSAHGLLRARRRVFCASLADGFDNEVDDLWRVDLFQLILATPNLDWLLLTKRIGNVATLAPRLWMRDGFPANVWLGATVVNQHEADRDIPKLLQTPAKVRFLSVEPMLGEVRLDRVMRSSPDSDWTYCDNVLTGFRAHVCGGSTSSSNAIQWVICGGESGPNARPVHPNWVKSLRDQCEAAGVPFLFKQWGEWLPSDEFTSELNAEDGGWPHNDNSKWSYLDYDEDDHQWVQGFDPSEDSVWRVGKKRAGRTLDGCVWNHFPTTQGRGL